VGGNDKAPKVKMREGRCHEGGVKSTMGKEKRHIRRMNSRRSHCMTLC